MSEDESLNRDVRAFSRSQAIDRTQDYVQRGRPFAAIDAAALKDQWVEAYRKWCRAVRNYELQREANDIESELSLRGEEVPIDRVVADMHALADALKQELMKLDGEQLKRMGETMLAELQDYRRRSRARH